VEKLNFYPIDSKILEADIEEMIATVHGRLCVATGSLEARSAGEIRLRYIWKCKPGDLEGEWCSAIAKLVSPQE
jgi:hypothetical protein